MSFLTKLAEKLSSDLGLPISEESFSIPPNPKFGDLSLFLPAGFAAPTSSDWTQVGRYLNLKIPLEEALQEAHPPKASPPKGTRVMIEFSQPNTHKAFHIGHLRNLCIGDTLVRLFRFEGFDTLSANYYGDMGTHIAKCLWNLGSYPRESWTPNGEWLGERYVEACRKLEKSGAHEEVSRILRALEGRTDPQLTSLWRETREWSLQEFREIYAWAGVHFDVDFYESDLDQDSLNLISEYVERGVFVEEEGAIGIRNEEIPHKPFFPLRKSDGTSLYSAKDLALALCKFRKFGVRRSIYVVDSRQTDHFKHVFLTLQKMGFDLAGRCDHVGYEMVTLPEGAMSSRKGTAIPLRVLREEMRAHLLETCISRDQDWEPTELERVVNQLSLGALKFGMLARGLEQQIVFSLPQWISTRGDTGPYLQYSGTRARSLIQKTEASGDLKLEGLPEERQLLVRLLLATREIRQSQASMRPVSLCNYLLDLCKSYNRFQQHCRVRGTPFEGGRRKLALTFLETLETCLGLLGIEVPQRM